MSQTIQTSDLDTFRVKTIDQAVGIFSFISGHVLIHFLFCLFCKTEKKMFLNCSQMTQREMLAKRISLKEERIEASIDSCFQLDFSSVERL